MLTVVPSPLDSIGGRWTIEHLRSHSFRVDLLLRLGCRMRLEVAPILCHPYSPHCVVECDVLSDSPVPVCTDVAGAAEEGAIAVGLFVVHTIDF